MSEVSLGREEPITESTAPHLGATVIDIATRKPVGGQIVDSDGAAHQAELLRGPYIGRLRAAERMLEAIRTQFGHDPQTVTRYQEQVTIRRRELELFDAKDDAVDSEDIAGSSDDAFIVAAESSPILLELPTAGQEVPKPAAPHTAASSRQREVRAVFSEAQQVLNPLSLEWQDDSKCTESNAPDDFFFKEQKRAADTARRLCGGCTVRAFCLAYALETGEEHGVWGGVSERDRRKLSKEWFDRPLANSH